MIADTSHRNKLSPQGGQCFPYRDGKVLPHLGEFRVEPFFLYIGRSQLGWFWYVSIFHMDVSLRGCSRHISILWGLERSPGYAGLEHPKLPQRTWRKCLGRGKSGCISWNCCLCNQVRDEQKTSLNIVHYYPQAPLPSITFLFAVRLILYWYVA